MKFFAHFGRASLQVSSFAVHASVLLAVQLLFIAGNRRRKRDRPTTNQQERDENPRQEPEKSIVSRGNGVTGGGLLQIGILASCIPWGKLSCVPIHRAHPLLAATCGALNVGRNLLGSFAGPLISLWGYRLTARILAPAHSRSLQFWCKVIPIYLGYKKTQFAVRNASPERRAECWRQRHHWGANMVYDLCVSMRGFYLKDGQYLGSRTDFIPLPWCNRLRNLQDNVPPVPWAQIRDTLKSTYCVNSLTQVFLSVQETPLASATIAQIHRATLFDGTEIVIKAQYADQERLCKLDLQNLGRLATFLEKHDMKFMDMTSVVKEFSAQIPLEFDFIAEAISMATIRENLEHAGISDIVIPQVILGLVERRAIAMTFMDGVRPDNAVALNMWGISPRKVVETVGHAVAQMMLVDGFMHADVHLGNLLVMRDGRVCLLDFGQCKRVPECLRINLCTFYMALCSGNKFKIAQAFSDIGVRLEITTDKIGEFLDLVPTYANGMFDTGPVPEGIDISPFSENSPLRAMPIKQLPPDLFMILRTMGLLRALCESLNVQVTMSSVFRAYAAKGLRTRRGEQEIVQQESSLIQLSREIVADVTPPVDIPRQATETVTRQPSSTLKNVKSSSWGEWILVGFMYLFLIYACVAVTTEWRFLDNARVPGAIYSLQQRQYLRPF